MLPKICRRHSEQSIFGALIPLLVRVSIPPYEGRSLIITDVCLVGNRSTVESLKEGFVHIGARAAKLFHPPKEERKKKEDTSFSLQMRKYPLYAPFIQLNYGAS
jgi:hypothetical protein